MVRKLNEHNYNKYSHILAEDEEIDSLSQLRSELKTVANDLGYNYIDKSENGNNKGIISISDDVNIVIQFRTKIDSIRVEIGKYKDKQPTYNCYNNSAAIDEISVSLQTASMICSELRKKLI